MENVSTGQALETNVLDPLISEMRKLKLGSAHRTGAETSVQPPLLGSQSHSEFLEAVQLWHKSNPLAKLTTV